MTELIRVFDDSLLGFIQRSLRAGVLDAVMPFVSYLGSGGLIWIVTALVFICKREYRAAGITVLIALSLCGLVGNLALKPLIARPRPYDVVDFVLLVPPLTDFSFPSGHTMASFAAAVVIRRRSRGLGIGAFALGSAIAFSRLYLFVHYPTDILAGAALGVALGFLAVYLFGVLQRRARGPGTE